METKKVDLEITKYGKFIFSENPNGNYSIVKFPFTKETITNTLDVGLFLNSGAPEGFSFKLYENDKLIFTTPLGQKTMVVSFTKKGVRFYREKRNKYDYSNRPQVAVDFSPTEVKVLTVFQKLYQSFWNDEFITNKVSDTLALDMDVDSIYLKSDSWGTRRYIINHDVVIDVKMSTIEYKVIGLWFEDDDAGRSWIDDIASINGEIESLTKKRDRLQAMQDKFNN